MSASHSRLPLARLHLRPTSISTSAPAPGTGATQ